MGASWLGSFGWLNHGSGDSIPWYLAGGIPAANCLAAYKPLSAASLAASYINLAHPGTYDGTAINAPVWGAATGWVFAQDWLVDTGIDGANTYSCIIRFSNFVADKPPLFGEITTGQTNLNIYPSLGGQSYFRDGGALNAYAIAYLSGVLAVTPAKAYANGAPLAALVGSLVGTTTNNILVGGVNADGVGGPSANHTQAFAIYDITLSDAQVLAISTAMAALT